MPGAALKTVVRCSNNISLPGIKASEKKKPNPVKMYHQIQNVSQNVSFGHRTELLTLDLTQGTKQTPLFISMTCYQQCLLTCASSQSGPPAAHQRHANSTEPYLCKSVLTIL